MSELTITIKPDFFSTTGFRTDNIKVGPLHVTAGQSLYLAGRNGSGKTSFVRALSGLARLRSGQFQITSKASFLPAFVYKSKGFTMDKFLETFAHDYYSALTWICAAEKKKAFPEDSLFRDVSEFSDGQFRMLNLITTLSTGNDLFVLDEPDNYLDETAISFLKEICNLLIKKNKAIIYTGQTDLQLNKQFKFEFVAGELDTMKDVVITSASTNSI